MVYNMHLKIEARRCILGVHEIENYELVGITNICQWVTIEIGTHVL